MRAVSEVSRLRWHYINHEFLKFFYIVTMYIVVTFAIFCLATSLSR